MPEHRHQQRWLRPGCQQVTYGLSYENFVVPPVKAIQEQQALIEKQQQESQQLKKVKERFKKLEEEMLQLKKIVTSAK